MAGLPRYPVDGHPLLSTDALALDSDQLLEQTLVAERVLQLRGPARAVFTGEAAEDAARAVALQVSLQAAQDPEAYLAESVGRGSEQVNYRGGVLLHPLAETLILQLAAELADSLVVPGDTGWPITAGWRGEGVR